MALSLVLGSASPRRARLLSKIGVPFDVLPRPIAEEARPGEAPRAYVSRLAREKAAAVSPLVPESFVLTADTTVAIDGAILGKPLDEDEARSMLHRLSGAEHVVLTAVALTAPGGELIEEICEESTVRFRRLHAGEVVDYVSSGEPMDKAGAYAIQGGAADFVTRLQGSYENVIGLPIDAVRGMLERAGLYPPRIGP